PQSHSQVHRQELQAVAYDIAHHYRSIKNGDNSRYFAFSAEPEKSCTPSTLDFSEPAEKTTISSNSRRF
ncbi:MAG: hypothetical protein MR783_00965, partial [Clostridiales bacterium]|nr:hypothetical protein [Clostridiales bacterium]